ncbi:hypothetical protein [Sphingorhabdus sp.]|mgnify:FL=1|jgi:hypothetical protein|uniref:hypothetical protein n=1 Tax=Sphingorhabdus sp. TaxID=1902408 RepID=UPI003BB223B5|nr:hypothetical protein [Sphingomonadales bacterium]MBK9431100.1 hypothetical protein [Sphingomonadales bacterium]MBL0021237.1 hypothetical protein [Sphingomonadales bacterium]
MNRRLVCTTEGAGHPFRRAMPMEALRLAPQEKPKPMKWWQKEDAHLFVVSFGAFFTVFYTFFS